MGQYWKIVCLEKAQVLENHGGVKLWELLMNGVPEQLVDLLKVPKLRAYKFSNAAVASARARSIDIKLIAIPQEIIDEILTYITSGVDLINLGLSCSYFFRLLGPVLIQAIVESEAPWAGRRLVTVGDYAEGIPSCVEPDTIRYIVSQGMDDEYWDDEGEADEAMARNPLYRMGAEEISDRLGMDDALRCCGRAHRHHRSTQIRRLAYLHMNAGEVELLDRLTRHPAPTTSLQAVLRCLDLKEFVRDDVIASSEYAYSLGEVLCCFSTWTADGPCGRWAGCRFDITVSQHVDYTWTDVSEEAVEYLQGARLDRKTDGKRA
ncbi:hypothetical protein LTR56_002299 [Elasticomyces elasticus]|nr:hypothetical protein LTR56_002299 [Elasticomyces elasticus]KAK3665864.1 hypothetical protein LTR22_003182 [Elasticomyces elasticus]KAK4929336.1 hypothetical protein LTR49_003939 [Elasticomyces elasticus]KAK5764625.1 hypothetical protein LTS12_005125 [Elasticomyces elasticus]